MYPDQFFKGLKVIELASVLAGPAVGMFFAELGASVLKIENKQSYGDVTRKWKLPIEEELSGSSSYFASVNWNKKSLFLNLKDNEDYAIAMSFIRQADIVISNFKPSTAEKLKMDYASIKKQNERIIMGVIKSYNSNPEKGAFDVVLQAEAGYLSMTGTSKSEIAKMPVAFIDLMAAHQLKEGLLLALLKKEREGKGSLVEASLFETAIASLANQASGHLMTGHIPSQMGTAHPNIAPYGDLFETKDGKTLVLAVGSNTQFLALVQALGLEEFIEDKRFGTNQLRVINRKDLNKALKSAILEYNLNSICELFSSYKVPFGKINNLKEVFEMEESKNLVLNHEFAGYGASKMVRSNVFTIK